MATGFTAVRSTWRLLGLITTRSQSLVMSDTISQRWHFNSAWLSNSAWSHVTCMVGVILMDTQTHLLWQWNSSADIYLHNEQRMTTLHQSVVLLQRSQSSGEIKIKLETLKFITLTEGSCQSVVVLGQLLMKWRRARLQWRSSIWKHAVRPSGRCQVH